MSCSCLPLICLQLHANLTVTGTALPDCLPLRREQRIDLLVLSVSALFCCCWGHKAAAAGEAPAMAGVICPG